MSNQNLYRNKWFNILESQFIDNVGLFWTKNVLVLSLDTMSVILCSDVTSEQSKI